MQSVEEIREALQKFVGHEGGDDCWWRLTGGWPYTSPHVTVVPGVDDPVEFVEHFEGEPGYEDFSGVIYYIFKIGDRYFRKEGKNVSHHGYKWEYGAFFEVTPKVEVRTVWR